MKIYNVSHVVRCNKCHSSISLLPSINIGHSYMKFQEFIEFTISIRIEWLNIFVGCHIVLKRT
jgi:hypothetical protein